MNTFPRTALRIAGGLLSWLACFVVVYIFTAISVARGFDDARVGGVRWVTVVTVIAVACAAAINAALLRRALLDTTDRFLAFVTFATSLVGLIALALLALPLLVVAP